MISLKWFMLLCLIPRTILCESRTPAGSLIKNIWDLSKMDVNIFYDGRHQDGTKVIAYCLDYNAIFLVPPFQVLNELGDMNIPFFLHDIISLKRKLAIKSMKPCPIFAHKRIDRETDSQLFINHTFVPRHEMFLRQVTI